VVRPPRSELDEVTRSHALPGLAISVPSRCEAGFTTQLEVAPAHLDDARLRESVDYEIALASLRKAIDGWADDNDVAVARFASLRHDKTASTTVAAASLSNGAPKKPASRCAAPEGFATVGRLRRCRHYCKGAETGTPATHAALTWNVAVPDPAPAGTRKFTW